LETEKKKYGFILNFFPERKWVNLVTLSILSVILFMALRIISFNLDKKKSLDINLNPNYDLLKDKAA